MNAYRKYFDCNIGGQLRTLRFGINCTALYCELRASDLHDFENDFDNKRVREGKTDPACIRDITWAALKEGERWRISQGQLHYVIKPFSNEDVGVWLDDMSLDDKNDFAEKFTYVMASNFIEGIESASKEKKNLHGNKF